MRRRLINALRSPTLWSAAILAGGGVGFALGTILLARILPREEFGQVALLLSLLQVGAALGSLGLPTLVNRHRLHPGRQLLQHALASGCVAAIIMSLFALHFYQISNGVAYLLGAAVALAAISRVAGSVLQSRHRFGASMLLAQVYNWLLLASVPLVLAFEQRSAGFVALVVSCSCLLIALAGWSFAARIAGHGSGKLDSRTWWSEGVSAAGFSLALNLFFQLDRMVIGRVLSFDDVATYAVVAAIAGAPFRMLQVAAGHSLVPRLRTAVAEGRTATGLIRREGVLLATVSICAALILLPLTQAIIKIGFEDDYRVSHALVAAVILVGLARVFEGFVVSVVTAIGTPRQLSLLTLLGWSGVGAALLGAVAVRGQGLIAVVYALGLGWAVVAFGAAPLSYAAWKMSAKERGRPGGGLEVA
jgi:O-antigen/teichoic acid export membrane protein